MEITNLIILWMFFIRTGQCDSKTPIIPKMTENHTERFYKCNFNGTVDCLWQKNGVTTSIYPYKYVQGNGRNTKDCSIVANLAEPKLNVECVGLIKSILTSIGSATQLNCSSDNKIDCSWSRNEHRVNIDNNQYRYTRDHNGDDVNDCSITIVNTTAIDMGTWKCMGNSDDRLITSYELRWKLSSTEDNTDSQPSQPPKSFDEIINFTTSSNLSTSTSSSSIISISITTKTDQNLNSTSSATESPLNFPLSKEAFAAITVSTTLFNVIIIVIIVIYRRFKRKSKKIKNQEIRLTVQDDVGGLSPMQLPRSPIESLSHTYYNAEAIASPLNSTDADGYLIAKKADRRNTSDNKTGEYESVKNHVYEKIL